MADNARDTPVPKDLISSSNTKMSPTSPQESDPQASSTQGSSIKPAANGVLSHDFAQSGMEVDTADNTNDIDGIAEDAKSEAGTTASGDAQTAASTMDGSSILDSTDESVPMQEDGNPDSGAAGRPNSYKARVQARQDQMRASMPTYNSAQKYAFSSVYNIPQNTVQTNAIALPPCSSHLFTGGSDGYIRRYAWYASLRNHPSERHPVLRGYWENLSITAIQARGLLWNASMQDDPSRVRFGPAGISGGTTVPVHSLAVQRDEMYCLAGSAEGVINLYSVRLDEGQCRACLGIVGKGHKRNSPVSALGLSEKDGTLISGGWDKQILVS